MFFNWLINRLLNSEAQNKPAHPHLLLNGGARQKLTIRAEKVGTHIHLPCSCGVSIKIKIKHSAKQVGQKMYRASAGYNSLEWMLVCNVKNMSSMRQIFVFHQFILVQNYPLSFSSSIYLYLQQIDRQMEACSGRLNIRYDIKTEKLHGVGGWFVWKLKYCHNVINNCWSHLEKKVFWL